MVNLKSSFTKLRLSNVKENVQNLRSLRMKIGIGFIATVILFTLVVSFILFMVNGIVQSENKVIQVEFPKASQDQELRFNIAQRISAIRAYLLTGNKDFITEFMKYTVDSSKAQKKRIENTTDEAKKQQLIEFEKLSQQWKEIILSVIIKYRTGDTQGAIELNNTTADLAKKMTDITIALTKDTEKKLALQGEETASKAASVLTISWISILIIIGLSLAMSWWLSGTITKNIKTLKDGMDRLAAGDLSQKVKISSKDEVGQLGQAFNHTLDSLQNMLKEISQSSLTLSASAEELQASSEQMTQAIEHVTETIEQIAVGAETTSTNIDAISNQSQEMVKKAKNMGHISGQMVMSSQAVGEAAVQGGQAVDSSVRSMNNIQSIIQKGSSFVQQLDNRSREIGAIVEIITNISRQTNLLALNAAIEASRAGEHGRGFNVVAAEIRKLANETENSTVKIEEIIEQIQGDTSQVIQIMRQGNTAVSEGVDLVHRSGEALGAIQTKASETLALLNDVAVEINNQVKDIDVIHQLIQEVAAVSEETTAGTQTTSAATEQTLATAQDVHTSSVSLSKLAEKLSSLVGKFKV